MTKEFDEVITARSRLREIMGEPSERVANKSIDHLDDICRRFIAASPFVLLGTVGADGLPDVSPKGDPAGFVLVRDEHTLIVPDRPGNRRLDTFENLLINPQIGMLFLIPGFGFTLRVAGKASLVRDDELQGQLAVNGKRPELLVSVTVEEAYMHCAKSMSRSKIWSWDQWPDISDVPGIAEAMVAHANLTKTIDEMQEIVDKDFENRMY